MPRKKTQKKLSLLGKTKNMKPRMGRDDIAKNIALGATGVAITAGVVAAGAALVNRNMRNKMGKAVEESVKMLRENAAKAPGQAQKYMATAHQIRGSKSRRGRKSTKSQAAKA